MSRRTLAALLPGLIAAACLPAVADESGFTSLFDGKDLNCWFTTVPDNPWVVEDGVITLKCESDGGENSPGYLWTKDTYADFVLELEFKIPERANSGVFLRTPDLKNPVYTGIEVQVCNSYGRERLSRGGTAGAIYDCLAPTKNTVKEPGQWNHYRIMCCDNVIQVELNGERVVDMDLDRWTEPRKNPDGSPNKFPTALKDFARSGHIGLQDHGLPVSYRNIRVKRLDGSKATYRLTPDEHGVVLKTPEGRTVFRYMTKKPARTNLTANSVCCLYPLNTPSGERVVDFAPGDHRHHRGVFLAWHATEGTKPADFWGWGEWAPTAGRVIRNRSVELAEADEEHAVLEVRNDWMVDDKAVIKEATTITTCQPKGVRVIDVQYKLTSTEDVTLKQTAFGGFCVKGRKDGKAYYTDPGGKVDRPSPHHLKPESDWPAADWYDYTIDLNSDKTVGICVMDHPDNPPTTWHNLEPIAMVNPCIVSPGPVVLKTGQPLVLRYRLVVHDGPPPMEVLGELSDDWRGR